MHPNLILEKVNNMIEEMQYDRRFIPFIFYYFFMVCGREHLNEKDLEHRISLYKERVHKIKYLYIGKQKVKTNFDLKCIYVDELIKTDTSDKTLNQYIYDAYSEQDIITTYEFVSNHSRFTKYIFDELRYVAPGEDLDYITDILSNAFDLPKSHLFSLNDYINTNLQKVNKDEFPAYYNYLHDTQFFLLRPLDSNIRDSFNAKSDYQKIDNYISIYSLALLAIDYRLDIENIDMGILKYQFEEINRSFSEVKSRLNIEASKLITHRIDPHWVFPLQEKVNELTQRFSDFNSFKKTEQDKFLLNTGYLKQDLRNIYLTPEPVMHIAIAMQEVESLIQKKQYDTRFTLLIKEYFRRSIIIYNWSADVFYKKLENYGQNIDTIIFEKIKTDKRNNSSFFFEEKEDRNSNKKLFIDKKAVNNSPKNFILSFFHEQKHFTDKTHTSYEGGLVKGYDKLQILNEYATQIGAVKLLGEEQFSDDLYITHVLEGYEHIQYAGSMMAGALRNL